MDTKRNNRRVEIMKFIILIIFFILTMCWMTTLEAKTIWNDNITFGAAPSVNNKSVTFGSTGTANIGGLRFDYGNQKMQASHDNSSWFDLGAGFTDPMTTRGDIIIRNSSNVTDRLAIGADTYVLTSDGTDVSWAAAGGGATVTGTPTEVAFFNDSGDINSTDQITISPTAVTVSGTAVMPNLMSTTATPTAFLGLNDQDEIIKVLGFIKSADLIGWTAFTPAPKGFGTVSNAVGWYRRVQDSMEIRGFWTNGTTSGAITAQLAIPGGYSLNTSVFTVADRHKLGDAYYIASSGAFDGATRESAIWSDGADTDDVFISIGAAGNTAIIRSFGNQVAASNTSIAFNATIPIDGWDEYSFILVPSVQESYKLVDGVTEPATSSGNASIFIDIADGDLKIKFSDGVIKTIVTD